VPHAARNSHCWPHGAGKSTAAPALLDGRLGIENFVNADVIAKGLSAFNPEAAAIQAGRVILQRIRELAGRREDFAFETTLASRSFASWIATLREEAGYEFHLRYLWVPAPEMAMARVAGRVHAGGHFVPDDVVARRYRGGISNFFSLYRPIADEWKVYDNSPRLGMRLIAEGEGDAIPIVYDPLIWARISGDCHVMSTRTKPDIAALLKDSEGEARDMREGVRQEIIRRKRLGLSIIVWEDGHVVEIPADQIPENGWDDEPSLR